MHAQSPPAAQGANQDVIDDVIVPTGPRGKKKKVKGPRKLASMRRMTPVKDGKQQLSETQEYRNA